MSLPKRAILGFFSLPRLMQVGLVILALGGSLDLIYHAAPSGWIGTLEIYLGQDGYNAHVVTLIGMLVTLAGLLLSRWSFNRRRTPMQHSN
jgi:hypothetical protein